MATGTIKKTKSADVYDATLEENQASINERLTSSKGSGSATAILTNYTGTNYYTFTGDGIVYLRNDSGNNGSVQIQFSDNTPTMLMGGTEGYYLLHVRKNWKARTIGTPYLCYFFKFAY